MVETVASVAEGVPAGQDTGWIPCDRGSAEEMVDGLAYGVAAPGI